jgi:hypothetical protein
MLINWPALPKGIEMRMTPAQNLTSTTVSPISPKGASPNARLTQRQPPVQPLPARRQHATNYRIHRRSSVKDIRGGSQHIGPRHHVVSGHQSTAAAPVRFSQLPLPL